LQTISAEAVPAVKANAPAATITIFEMMFIVSLHFHLARSKRSGR
jgi:hypothetical protein